MAIRNNFLRKIEVNLRFLLVGGRDEENKILRRICVGRGADIGCGSNKVCPNCIGVDLFGRGEIGRAGCERGRVSDADYKASGDNLFMFKEDELDFVVAKHNLEHYKTPERTLQEWKRVLKKGGKIGVIVPDDRFVNTFQLDPTHFCLFTPASLLKLFEKAGFKNITGGISTPHWSIYCIAEK